VIQWQVMNVKMLCCRSTTSDVDLLYTKSTTTNLQQIEVIEFGLKALYRLPHGVGQNVALLR